MDAAWVKEKAEKGYTDDTHSLAFRNKMLTVMLAEEPLDVRENVDRVRERDIKARLVKEEEDVEFLQKGEEDLPVKEKERLKIVRARAA